MKQMTKYNQNHHIHIFSKDDIYWLLIYMNRYREKYNEYKIEYLLLNDLMTNNGQIGGRSVGRSERRIDYCKLPKDAILYFGSGGSDGIVAVVRDRVYKYYPIFIYPSFSSGQIYIKNINRYEIGVIKTLTQKIIRPKLSPHLIEYYGHYKCDKIPNDIFKDCPSYAEHLKSSKHPSQKCNLVYGKGYPRSLERPMYVLEMSKADDSLENMLVNISKKKWNELETFLNRLFFQVLYTLE